MSRFFWIQALLFFTGFSAAGQGNAIIDSIQSFQNRLNAQFADSVRSPLTADDRMHFNGLVFFPADTTYTVTARFIRTSGQPPFEMVTTTSRRPVYEKYGEAHFRLGDSSFVLNLYQSHTAREKPEYANHLFLPYTDLTNGFESYGGGRYIDITIPEGEILVIDFNQSYNPYCCYNHKYSCPIPPKENFLNYRVAAGVMSFKGKE